MIIRLNREQESRLLEWAGETTRAHTDADLEPPGYALEIDILPALGAYAEATCGNSRIDLGEVDMQLEFVTDAKERSDQGD